MRIRRMALAIFLLGSAALLADGQTTRERSLPNTPTIEISGRVVADSGEALPNARVTLVPPPPTTPVVLTDSDGRFEFRGLRPEKYRVAVTKSRYARKEMPAPPGGGPLAITLVPSAVIAGRVVDEFGEPVPAIRVVAETRSERDGRSTMAAVTQTDDLGAYRLTRLSAGIFNVSVMVFLPAQLRVIGATTLTYGAAQKVYYPGVASVGDAEAIALGAGDERSGTDFVIPADRETPWRSIVTAGVARSLLAGANDAPGVRGRAVVRGRVTTIDGGPLAHAQVALVPSSRSVRPAITMTDVDGRYEFVDVVSGPATVTANKVGYYAVESSHIAGVGLDGSSRTINVVQAGLPLGGGFETGSSRALELKEGEARERVDFTFARWSTLVGTVVDEHSEPLEGAVVQGLQVRFQEGRRRLMPVGPSSTTDDLGQYRLYDLPPGGYVISASIGGVASDDVPGYARSYFPGTDNAAQAQFVTVAVAQEIPGVDISLVRGKTARVAGRLLNAAGEPTTGGSVRLLPSARSTSPVGIAAGARLLPDGGFEFPNVPPGDYVVQAYRGRSNATEGEFGALPVNVTDSDVTDLVVTMSRGSSIAGRIIFDSFDGSKLPNQYDVDLVPIPVALDLSPAGASSWAHAEVRSDGTFRLAGVNGSRRLQPLTTPAGWSLKEIRVRGVDITDRALPFGRAEQSLADVEVVLTNRITNLTGTIVDENGRGVAGRNIIAFPTDRDRWFWLSRFVRKTAAIDGTFAMSGLPAGSYYVASIGRLPAEGEDSWQDPGLLESLVQGASTATLIEGQTSSIALTVSQR